MTQSKKRHILVTCALPYANGDLHLGNLVEFIQTDLWVRFQRLCDQNCYFICGDDAHGTPIMLNAEKKGISPETLIETYYQNHKKDLNDFQIALDHYHTTHSPENQALANQIYLRLKDKGDIVKRDISQAFDPEKKIFLPDRYVKGECPKCSAQDQYGDNCEACGTTYTPLELKNPRSAISGATPIRKTSEHYFFCLDHYTETLNAWTQAGHLQPEITQKLKEWFDVGLQQWDISRDAPYFGFEIPEAPGKYFYVWLDAPIGYMASFKQFCEQTQKAQFEDYWVEAAAQKAQTELYHFIGKDIVYFHALFWPAMLLGSQYRTPTAIFVHGFLTVNGKKMSKSRGTLITARTYLNHLPPEYLRYYYAAKLTTHVEDLDLNLADFAARINSDLVGKYVNIASRCSKILEKQFQSRLSARLCEPTLFEQFVNAQTDIANHFENRDFSKAVREIMNLADLANRYIASKAPWALLKSTEPKNLQQAHEICSLGLNLFRILTIYLKPILPNLAHRVEDFLNIPSQQWSDLATPLLDHTLNPFQPLIERIDPKVIKKMMLATSKTTSTPKQTKPMIQIDDFAKLDLRVGRIIQAESVEGADKLLKLQVDIGEETPRQVFAGIKSAYAPEDLENQLVAFVANLAPRKMRFGVSQGMVMAAGAGGSELFLLTPHPGAKPGMPIK